jgi:hypothetical protein
MSSFSLNLNIDNAAFGEDRSLEIARILREAADKLEAGSTGSQLRDFNGNRVGQFVIDIDE